MNKLEQYNSLRKQKISLKEEIKAITSDILDKKNTNELIKSSSLPTERKKEVSEKLNTDILRVIEKHGDRLEQINKEMSKIDLKIGKLRKSKQIREIDDYSKLKETGVSKSILDYIQKKNNDDNKVHYSDVIVYNEEGKLLFLKRSNLESNYPNTWTLAGGHVDAGEEHIDAASRELWEESGILKSPEEFDLIGVYSNDDVVINYYTCCIDESETNIVVEDSETQDYMWCYLSDLIKKDITLPYNMKENIFRFLGYPEQGVKLVLEKMDIKESPNLIKSRDKEMMNAFSLFNTMMKKDKFINFVENNGGIDINLLQKAKLIKDYKEKEGKEKTNLFDSEILKKAILGKEIDLNKLNDLIKNQQIV